MDAEAHQLFQARLHRRILEAEKEAETIRADKYLNIILGTLACEDGFGTTQPEASWVLHPATSALARPTSPASSVCCPNLYRGGVLMLTRMAPSFYQVQLWPKGRQSIPPWRAEGAIHHLPRTSVHQAQRGLMYHDLLP